MVTKLLDFEKTGNTIPVIIEMENKPIFVKLRAGMSGKYSLLNEWLGNELGNHLGLNCQIPQWIVLTDDIRTDGVHQEVADLIKKSLGINLAFPYQKEMRILSLSELNGLDKMSFQKLLLLDLLLLNPDRTFSNCNMAMVSSQVIPLDFESSLFFSDLMSSQKLSFQTSFISSLKANLFYQPISSEVLHGFIFEINNFDWEKAIVGIPNELFSEEDRKIALYNLNIRANKQWFLPNILEILDKTSVESEEDKKERILNNRLAFEKRMRDKNV